MFYITEGVLYIILNEGLIMNRKSKFKIIIFLTVVMAWCLSSVLCLLKNRVILSLCVVISAIFLVGLIRYGLQDKAVCSEDYDRFLWRGKLLLSIIVVGTVYYIEIAGLNRFEFGQDGWIWSELYLLAGLVGILTCKDTNMISSLLLCVWFIILVPNHASLPWFCYLETFLLAVMYFIAMLLANIDLRLSAASILRKHNRTQVIMPDKIEDVTCKSMFRKFWELNKDNIQAVSLARKDALILYLADQPSCIEYTLSDGRKVMKYDPCKLAKIDYFKYMKQIKHTKDDRTLLLDEVKKILEKSKSFEPCDYFTYRIISGYKRVNL